MRDGRKTCVYCLSRFEFIDYELVDSMPAEDPCPGCVALYAILEKSARLKAEMKLAPAPDVMDLSASANLARLLQFRRQSEPEPFDARMAALPVGDRD